MWAYQRGILRLNQRDYSPRMQLIQIGEPVVPTVQLLIEQMASRQHSEIEQLKQAALAEYAARRARAPRVARRTRCERAA